MAKSTILDLKRRSDSNESDFYGSEDERARLERLCDEFDAAEFLNRPPTLVEQMLRLNRTPDMSERAIVPGKSNDRSKPATSKNRVKEKFNPFAHERSAWQLDEPLEDFIERLPPSRTLESDAGFWIWVANPYSQHRETKADYRGLLKYGEEILEKLTTEKEDLGKKKTAVFAEVRAQAQKEILEVAKARSVTTGKWLLFRNAQEIDEAWATVAAGTINGELGCSAKVATRKSLTGGDLDQVICVYTENFADEDDVVRVLQELDKRGVVARYGPLGHYKGIYYKPDVYTHLGISSGNSWGIAPSLYASTSFISPKSKRPQN